MTREEFEHEIDPMEFINKIKIQIEETETEFIYSKILPYSENILEKRLSKDELDKILLRGVQPSIPLEKIKHARSTILGFYNRLNPYDPESLGQCGKKTYEILSKLIDESEEQNNDTHQ